MDASRAESRRRPAAADAAAAAAADEAPSPLASVAPILMQLRKDAATQGNLMRGLMQRRAAERAAASAGARAGLMYEPDGDCSICYEPLDQPNSVVTTCGHVFHLACIEGAFEAARGGKERREGGGGCPLCRDWVDRGGLVKVCNGLPTRKEFRVADVEVIRMESDESGEDGVVDLDSGPEDDDGVVGFGGGFDATQGGSDAGRAAIRRARKKAEAEAKKDAKAKARSTREITREMDAEIVRTLKDGTQFMSTCEAMIETERALKKQEELYHAKSRFQEMDLAQMKSDCKAEIAKAKVELRSSIVKLDMERKEVKKEKEELQLREVEVRKLGDKLHIQIRNTQMAEEESKQKQVEAEKALGAMRDREERFKDLYEQKINSKKVDRCEVEALEKELSVTVKQRDALRRQVRNLKKQPPLPPTHAATKAAAIRDDILNVMDYTGVTDNDVPKNAVVDSTSVPTQRNSPVSSGDAESDADSADDSGDDDDVVAEADRLFDIPFKNIGKRKRTYSEESGVPVEDRVEAAESVFGALDAPAVGLARNAAPTRPQPARRRGRGARGVSMGVMQPPTMQVPKPILAIGAKRSTAHSSGNAMRPPSASPAPRAGELPGPKKRKSSVNAPRKTSKINSFFGK